ncbi:MAG: hypothetical protein JJ974_05225 [Phycisphaerales bacterium]|nr:hypothetical protein [Phycisphaerales bacterium]
MSTFLEERSFDDLLEVQLFDRLVHESDPDSRASIARRLGDLYLGALGRDDLDDESRGLVLAKGRVLIGMMPADQMLALRVEILTQLYAEHEQAPALMRIGLLDDESREAATDAMTVVYREMKRIAGLENIRVDQLVRSVSRASDDRVQDYEDQLSEARALRSRAFFFQGWSGYSEAVLRGRPVGGEVLSAFGGVLGFDGKLPVLSQMDLDLLEYDHVARAMLGVGLSKIQNNDLIAARSWLSSVVDSSEASAASIGFARQRLLEVSLLEHDWVIATQNARELLEYESGDLVGVAQARLLVIRPMDAIAGSGSRIRRGNGGREGAIETARLGLKRLVELGEIEHVLDLQQRYADLPLLESGFVGLYTQGLSSIGEESYSDAVEFLERALAAEDVGSYSEHAGDAVLRLAQCAIKVDRPSLAIDAIDGYRSFLNQDGQIQESAWLRVLALDQAVRDGQVQMEGVLKTSIEDYLAEYPLSERAELLIVRFALSPYMDPELAARSLVIDDPDNPMAIRARRKLIGLLYKHPELVDDGSAGGIRLHEVLSGHAAWVWANEDQEPEGLSDLSERLSIVRIMLSTGIWIDDVDTDFLMQAVERGERLVQDEPSLVSASSELAYRRVQVLLLDEQITRAGEIALDESVMNADVRANALLLVHERAFQAFERRRLVPEAQAVVRYGRSALDSVLADDGEGLDRRESLIAEQVASAAEYLGTKLDDESMRLYASGLSSRVYRHGTPSFEGLVRTARLSDHFDHNQEAMECWLLVVEKASPQLMVWSEARFESLRLMRMLDPDRARQVYLQFVLLYPEGLVEPWGSLLRELFDGGPDGGGLDD